MSSKTIIQTTRAPAAIGPFSQAVGYGGLFFLSGQIALDPHTGEMAHGGIEAQTRQVMDNLGAVLEAAGLDFSHVLRATIYLKNMSDFSHVNDIYAGYFDENPPARATVEVSRLPKDALIEIDAIAAAPPAPAPVEAPAPAAEDVPSEEEAHAEEEASDDASEPSEEAKDEAAKED